MRMMLVMGRRTKHNGEVSNNLLRKLNETNRKNDLFEPSWLLVRYTLTYCLSESVNTFSLVQYPCSLSNTLVELEMAAGAAHAIH